MRNGALPEVGACLSLIGGKTGKKRGNPSFVAQGVGTVTGRQMPFSGARTLQ